MACLACQVSWNKCSIDGKPMGPKKCPRKDKTDPHSPKKAQTTAPATNAATVPQVDKEGRAAYKVSGEHWVKESGAPEVEAEGSNQPPVWELLDEIVEVGEEQVEVGEEQIGLLREAVELLKDLKGGIKELNKVLRGSKIGWVAAGDEDGGVGTIRDD
jgi:hypothetical protein